MLASCNLFNFDNDKTQGTVTYLGFEGGFFGIITENDKHLDPINLKDEFKIDSLEIKFNYRKTSNQTNIHMWGTIVKLSNVEKID